MGKNNIHEKEIKEEIAGWIIDNLRVKDIPKESQLKALAKFSIRQLIETKVAVQKYQEIIANEINKK